MVFKKEHIPWNKGKKGTYHFSNKTQFKKGQTPWNKGIPMGEEAKKKMIQKKTGKKHSEESKIKMSNSIRKHYESPEGQYSRMLISQKLKEGFKSGKIKSHKGSNPPWFYMNEEQIKEAKRKLREARMKQILPTKNTLIECLLQKELGKRNIFFEKQLPILNITQPDILFFDKKIAVYADGDYWHNLPKAQKRDSHINKILKKNGWKVLRFWEHNIKNDVKECVDEIEVELNDNNT